MHPKLIVAIVKDGRRSRPGGAVTGQLHRLRYKRLARMTLASPDKPAPRNVVRRQANQRAHASAWTLATATSMLRIIGMEDRS